MATHVRRDMRISFPPSRLQNYLGPHDLRMGRLRAASDLFQFPLLLFCQLDWGRLPSSWFALFYDSSPFSFGLLL
jgi:hypothetical protein